MNGYGAKIGVHPQLASQAKQSLLRTLTRGGIVPARPTDRTEQDGVGASAKIDRLRRERSAARIECDSADQTLAQLDGVAKAFRDRAKNSRAFGNYLRSDAVAGKDGDRQ